MTRPREESGAHKAFRRIHDASTDFGPVGTFEERNEAWKAQYEKKSFMARKADYKTFKARCIGEDVDVSDMLVAAMELLLTDTDTWTKVRTRAHEIDCERPRK